MEPGWAGSGVGDIFMKTGESWARAPPRQGYVTGDEAPRAQNVEMGR